MRAPLEPRIGLFSEAVSPCGIRQCVARTDLKHISRISNTCSNLYWFDCIPCASWNGASVSLKVTEQIQVLANTCKYVHVVASSDVPLIPALLRLFVGLLKI